MSFYRGDIVNKIYSITHAMTERHSKTLVMRFDIHYPEGSSQPEKNEDLSRLLKSLSEWFRERGIDMNYLWAREQNDSDLPHYHVALWVNGSLMQNGHMAMEFVASAWNRILGRYGAGLIHRCNLHSGGRWHMLRRPAVTATALEWQMFNAEVESAVEHLGYLAKTYSKDRTPERTRVFGYSLS